MPGRRPAGPGLVIETSSEASDASEANLEAERAMESTVLLVPDAREGIVVRCGDPADCLLPHLRRRGCLARAAELMSEYSS